MRLLLAGASTAIAGCQTSSELVEAELRFQCRRVRDLEAVLAQKDEELHSLRSTISSITPQPAGEGRVADGKPLVEPKNSTGSAPAPAPIAAVSKISLTMLTGGKDTDGDGRDDGVEVVLAPLDSSGTAVRSQGTLEIRLIEVSPAGLKRNIGEWSFPADKLASMWRNSMFGPGYNVYVPWDKAPRFTKLRVEVAFTTLDHKRFEAEKDFEAALQTKGPPRSVVRRESARPWRSEVGASSRPTITVASTTTTKPAADEKLVPVTPPAPSPLGANLDPNFVWPEAKRGADSTPPAPAKIRPVGAEGASLTPPPPTGVKPVSAVVPADGTAAAGSEVRHADVKSGEAAGVVSRTSAVTAAEDPTKLSRDLLPKIDSSTPPAKLAPKPQAEPLKKERPAPADDADEVIVLRPRAKGEADHTAKPTAVEPPAKDSAATAADEARTSPERTTSSWAPVNWNDLVWRTKVSNVLQEPPAPKAPVKR